MYIIKVCSYILSVGRNSEHVKVVATSKNVICRFFKIDVDIIFVYDREVHNK